MNERIRLLAEQAGFIDRGSNHTAYMGFDHEKFAKLIVRECARIATYPELSDEESYYGNEFAKAIKKHFGVEE
jgi:hypothetical protein